MELMCNLGIDKLMSIEVSGVCYTDTTKLIKIEPAAATKKETGADMLEAHQNLVEADASNAPKFKDVIAYLREDLGAPGTD